MSEVLKRSAVLGLLVALSTSLAASQDVAKGKLPDDAAPLLEQVKEINAKLESGELVWEEGEPAAPDLAALLSALGSEEREALLEPYSTAAAPNWEGLPLETLQKVDAVELFGHLTIGQQDALTEVLAGNVPSPSAGLDERAEGQPVGYLLGSAFFTRYEDALEYIARHGLNAEPRAVGYLA